MSIFGTIMSKVFGHQEAAPGAAPTAAGTAPAGSAPSTAASPPSLDTTGSSIGTATSASPAAVGAQSIDVAAVLDGMDSHAGQKLDWRDSIVDLMKLLDMDSSLSARKELAHELNYTGDTNDSASMNIWLHKEVMAKFAANGGKLPTALQH